MGESLRLDMTLHHTGGGKEKGKRREGVLCNSEGNNTRLKEKNWKGNKTVTSERKGREIHIKLYQVIFPSTL